MVEHEGKIYYERYCRIFNMEEKEIDMILDIGERNFELFNKYNMYMSNVNKSTGDMIEFEEKIQEIKEKMNQQEEYYNKLVEKRDEEIKKLEEKNKQHDLNFENKIKDMKKEITDWYNDKIAMIEQHNELKLQNNENSWLLKYNEKLEEIKNYKEEFNQLKEKFGIVSAYKDSYGTETGAEFEKIFYRQLETELKYKEIWTISKCMHQAGKGDFLLTNNYTGYRIMIELKSCQSVSSKDESQQPKFIRDLKSKVNNYDAGIMIATGNIVGKMQNQIDIINGKIAYYISDYKLSDIKTLIAVLNSIFILIQHQKSSEKLNYEDVKREFIEIYKGLYDSSSRMNTLYESFNRDKKKLAEYIWKSYKIDPDEQMRILKTDSNFTIEKKDKIVREKELIEKLKNNLDILSKNDKQHFTKSFIKKMAETLFKTEIENKEIRKNKIESFAKEYCKQIKNEQIQKYKQTKITNIKIET